MNEIVNISLQTIGLGGSGDGGGNGTGGKECVMYIPIVEQTEETVTIKPNVLNRWGEVALLTIDFAEADPKKVAEYMVEFVSGETPTTLSLPAEVKFPYDVEIEPNMRYQLSVENNIGLIAGVEL